MRTVLVLFSIIFTSLDFYGQTLGSFNSNVLRPNNILLRDNSQQFQLNLKQNGAMQSQIVLRKGKLWLGSEKKSLERASPESILRVPDMGKAINSDKDINWDTQFGYLGVGYEYAGGWVTCVTAGPGNTLLVGGGYLNIVCNNGKADSISNIASWNGTTWATLKGGVNGPVYAICVKGNDVYVGGTFTKAGNVTVSNLARWDGSAWHPVGTGANVSMVNALAFLGNDLYVGGSITIGTVPSENIAVWNGSTWSRLGSGINGTVYAIATNNSDVYVGGLFSKAGDITVNSIAKWNGSLWSALGGGVLDGDSTFFYTGYVYSLAFTSNGLYIGGHFSRAGNKNIKSIALWNGSEWSELGNGISYGSQPGTVKALTQRAGNLYVGGTFTQAGNSLAFGAASYNISSGTWEALGYGLNNSVLAMYTDESSVYTGGVFTAAQFSNARNIARWDIPTKSWFPVGTGGNSGVDDYLNAIAYNNGSIYAGGWMYTSGGIPTNHIGEWNERAGQWWFMGSGVYSGDPNWDTPVFEITPDGDDIYVGGGFAVAGDIPVYGIARWNITDNAWDSLGCGVYSYGGITIVYAIAIDGDDVYCVGSFDEAGNISASNIARWNKTTRTWHSLGSGLYGSADAVAVDSVYVYVGGGFSKAGGIAVNNIARWNKISQEWSSMREGIYGGIYIPVVDHFAVTDRYVYVSGRFDNAGTIAAGNVARWDKQTETWSALGTGFPTNGQSHIEALTLYKNRLYAGGKFSSVNGIPARGIARYDIDKESWTALGSGINGFVSDIAVNGSDVYAAGSFYKAGEKASFCIAHYHDDPLDSVPTSIAEQEPLQTNITLFQNYPNPFNLTTTISYVLLESCHVTLSIIDRFGREVEVLVNKVEGPGYRSLTYTGSKLSRGIYFYRLKAGPKFITKKFLLLK